MTVPFALFLYIFLGIAGIVAVVTAINLYHLIRFGYFTPGVLIMAAAAVIVPGLILLATFTVLSDVAWGESTLLDLPSLPTASGPANLGELR